MTPRYTMLSQPRAELAGSTGPPASISAIGLALAAMLYGIASKPLAPIQWILVAALAAAALVVGAIDERQTRRAASKARVECLTGTIRVQMRSRAGWYLLIDGQSFKLPVHIWDVKNDARYRVYIAPKARRIVALEPNSWD